MPETSPFTSRSAADRCPGALRLLEAADGFLARVRLPGGLVSGERLRTLGRLAGELGDGRVELTSRGNVQLRGLAADAAEVLTSELARAGLLPSLGHDRVRNVLASPLAGLDHGADLTGIVHALDAALCARPRLAELPGRFLFAIDDGRGDVAGLGADVVATVRPDGAVVNGLKAATAGAGAVAPRADSLGTVCDDAGDSVPGDLRDGVVNAMLGFAEAFLDLRAEYGGTAWRVSDLPGGAERVRAAAAARLGVAVTGQGDRPRAGTTGPHDLPSGVSGDRAATDGRIGPGSDQRAIRPVGLVAFAGTGDGSGNAGIVMDDDAVSAVSAVVLIAPLGRLTSAQLSWVADVAGEREARVTPWRSVVLPFPGDAAGALREAAGLGFGTDAGSPWLRVTACAGRPGCASALADVQADAAGFAARWPGRLVHVSGCARHCGRPAATEIQVTATSEGYQVAGV